MWDVEYTDEWGDWFDSLDDDAQESIAASIALLEVAGPALARPHADTVSGSRYGHMKELRTQHKGEPYRTFFAFDPRRAAILLIGGCKTGDDRFYDRMLPIAERLYGVYLDELRKEGLIE